MKPRDAGAGRQRRHDQGRDEIHYKTSPKGLITWTPRKTCRKTFTATYGTFFYRKRTPEHEILQTLALLAEGSRIRSLARAKGFKEGTLLAWLREAAQLPGAINT